MNQWIEPESSPSAMISPVGTTITDETACRHARKYASRNPVQQWILRRFFRTIQAWLDQIHPTRVLDFGCGEGYFWRSLAALGPLPEVIGIDVRAEAVVIAREQVPCQTFLVEDLFKYDPKGIQFDLAVCSEVLEHLHDPMIHLRRLSEIAPRVLLTVPNEPYFRLSNLLRGRDLKRWGNHPEHVQQWSVATFRRFVSTHFEIEEVRTVFPFILVLGRSKGVASS